MKTDLELLKEYLQSEIDCGNHKLFIFDENNNATELKTIDGLNAITDLEQELQKANDTIKELRDNKALELVKISINSQYINTQNENIRLNNIINECADEILKELEENHHLSYGVALAIRQKLINYRELKESGNIG